MESRTAVGLERSGRPGRPALLPESEPGMVGRPGTVELEIADKSSGRAVQPNGSVVGAKVA